MSSLDLFNTAIRLIIQKNKLGEQITLAEHNMLTVYELLYRMHKEQLISVNTTAEMLAGLAYLYDLGLLAEESPFITIGGTQNGQTTANASTALDVDTDSQDIQRASTDERKIRRIY